MYKKTILSLKGLKCEMCAAKVRDALGAIDGVRDVNVCHKAGEATLERAVDRVDVEKLIAVVKGLGFDASEKKECTASACKDDGGIKKTQASQRKATNPQNIKKAIIPIAEMNCAACAANVENMVRSLSGVIEADVNYASEQLTISYDVSEISLSDV
ncbi:MAG: cation transporter, partial [Flavobacteriales bacterium]|nr:cation transporter [Flavobacteriales bacterium]